jgi:amino acid transporter
MNLIPIGRAWFDRLQVAVFAPSAAAFAALAAAGVSGSPLWSIAAFALAAIGSVPAGLTLRRLSRSGVPAP